MKRGTRILAALGWVMVVPSSATLQAQERVLSVAHPASGGAPRNTKHLSKLLARTAGLDVEAKRVAPALDALMRSAGVRIAYSESLLPRDHRVTCRCANVSVAAALDSLLAGLAYEWSEAKGQIVVEPLALSREEVQVVATISGIVTDSASDRPLSAAQVIVVGTTLGAMSGDDGRYQLRGVPAGRVSISVRRLGYAPAQRNVQVADGEELTLDFALVEVKRTLSEVVVTGTAGATTRREIGNSIASVNMDALASQPTPQVEDVIGARVPGATIMRNEGAAGAGSSVRVRGINSLTQGNRPLIYVDGVRLFSEALPVSNQGQSSSPLNDIDPNDIERIEIIKGAAATTLYGTEASNGVVQIFTKSGAGGKRTSWESRITQGTSILPQIGPGESDAFLARYGEEAKGLFMDDWVRNGHSQDYNLSVKSSTGGESPVNYFLSGGWGNEQGVLPEQDASTTNVRGNLGFQPNRIVNVRFNNSWTSRDIRWLPGGWNANSLTLNVMRGPFDYTQDRDSVFLTEFLTEENQNHFINGMSITLTPTANLSAKIVAGLDYLDSDYASTADFGSLLVPQGSRTERRFRNLNKQIDMQATYSRRLGSSITTATSAGFQFFDAQNLNVTGTSSRFAGPGSPTLNTGSQQNVTEARLRVVNAGYFIQELIGIADRLFITGGLRVDGNSAFGSGFGLQAYPKVSASYVLSDHGFWPKAIEEAKVRLAYGVSGKAPGYFDALRTWAPIAANEGNPGVSPVTLGNPNIGPERSSEIEGGFEAGAFDGRLTIDVSAYQQRTDDALLRVPQDPSRGFIDPQIQNVGTIENRGFEVSLRGVPYQRGATSWEIGVSASANKSKMADLGASPSFFVGQDLAPGLWVKEGYAVPGYWGPKLQNPTEIAAPRTTESYFGPVFPTRLMALSSTLNLRRGLSATALAEFQGGHYSLSHTAWRNVQRRVWPSCFAVVEKLEQSGASSLTAQERYECGPTTTSYGAYISKSDFWRLRSVAVNWELPRSITRGTGLWNLTLAGRNLLTRTDYVGLDPEVSQNGDGFTRWEYYQTPIPRSFSISVRTTF